MTKILGQTSGNKVKPVQVGDEGRLIIDARDGDKIWSFNDTVSGALTDTDLSAGFSATNTTVFPVGYIYIITTMTMIYIGTTPTYIRMSGIISGLDVPTFIVGSPTVSLWYGGLTNMFLKAGDNIRMTVSGATAGDTIIARYAGYRMQT